MTAEAVRAAAGLAQLAAQTAETSEREARRSAELHAAIAQADLFRLCVAKLFGGQEAPPGEAVAAIEALSEADGAAGWSLMIAATSGLVSGWLPEHAAREVFGRPDAPCGGVFAPRGRAFARDEGYLVSGRWAFSSGVLHSAWMLGGCVVLDGEQPRLLASGKPDVHVLAWPRAEIEVIETWSVTGLRGTGSHDMSLHEVPVPEDRAVSLFTGRPVQPGPLYAFPLFGMLAAGVASVGLGIASAALTAFVELAAGKTPSMSGRSLAEHPAAQASVASATARLSSARGFLYEAIEQGWEEAVASHEVSVERRAALRLAASHAAAESAAAVDAVYHAAGGSSIYTSSPLERRFRDLHTLRQHMIVGPSAWELAGRVLLGAEVDTTML